MNKEYAPSICSLVYAEAGNLCLEVGFEFNVAPRYLVSMVDSVLALKFLTD
jgi:hypothetical protein